MWSLDVTDNRVRRVDAACEPQPERSMPYRLRARFEPGFDAGGDLGFRDTLVREYQPEPEHASPGTLESFYFARGAGWFMWTRSDGVRLAFNRVGGIARQPSPFCARFPTLIRPGIVPCGLIDLVGHSVPAWYDSRSWRTMGIGM